MQAGKEKEQELETQFIGFTLGEREFAVDIRRVIEIIYFRSITPMPESPKFVEGVVDLRGKVIPVIDLRKILKMEGTDKGAPSHILIIRLRKRMVGVIVDKVQEVLGFNVKKIQSPQAFLGENSSPHLRGVYKSKDRLIFILSMGSLLSPVEANKIGQVQ